MKLEDKRIKQGKKEEASWLKLPEWREGEFVYFDTWGYLYNEEDFELSFKKQLIDRDDWEFVSKEREAKAGDFIKIDKGLFIITTSSNYPLVGLKTGSVFDTISGVAYQFEDGNYKILNKNEALEKLKDD